MAAAVAVVAAAVAAVGNRVQHAHTPLLSGTGIGWRPEIAPALALLHGVDFWEVIAESISTPRLPRHLSELRRTAPVIPHGVQLSLGSADGVDPHRVTHLARATELLDAPLASEHIAFLRSGGREAGHLLPLPRTREALDVFVRNTALATEELGVPLALEPIASVFEWPENEYSEPEFATEIAERTGCLLLLDVANVYANARNRGRDPVHDLLQYPLERVAYAHVAGGIEVEGVYHDTHRHAVLPEVLEMVAVLGQRVNTAFLLERDGQYPPVAQLQSELDAIHSATR